MADAAAYEGICTPAAYAAHAKEDNAGPGQLCQAVGPEEPLNTREGAVHLTNRAKESGSGEVQRTIFWL